LQALKAPEVPAPSAYTKTLGLNHEETHLDVEDLSDTRRILKSSLAEASHQEWSKTMYTNCHLICCGMKKI